MGDKSLDVHQTQRCSHSQSKSVDHINDKCHQNDVQSLSVPQIAAHIVRSHSFTMQTDHQSSIESSRNHQLKTGRQSSSLPELKDFNFCNKRLEENDENESLTISDSLTYDDVNPFWKSKAQFLFTALSLSFGLNNLWRYMLIV